MKKIQVVLKGISETDYILSNSKIIDAINDGDKIIASGNYKTTKLEDLWN